MISFIKNLKIDRMEVLKMPRYIKPKVDISELIFIEEEKSDVKCGKCNSEMYFQIYYKDKKTYDFLACKNCNIYLQRVIDNE